MTEMKKRMVKIGNDKRIIKLKIVRLTTLSIVSTFSKKIFCSNSPKRHI